MEIIKMDMKELKKELAHCVGSVTLHKNMFGLRYTKGIQYMIDKVHCYWLIDIVDSYMKLKTYDFLIIKLEVKEDNSAVFTAREDTDEPNIVKQIIPYTDFPVGIIEFYLCNGVLMQKSEY